MLDIKIRLKQKLQVPILSIEQSTEQSKCRKPKTTQYSNETPTAKKFQMVSSKLCSQACIYQNSPISIVKRIQSFRISKFESGLWEKTNSLIDGFDSAKTECVNFSINV